MYNILLVDDEHLIRERIKHCIDWSQYHCKIIGEADNGEKALQFVQTHPVDLAIVDINMPRMDGIEFARSIHNEQKNTFVAFLTGYEKFEYAQKAIQLGVFDYMLKPVRAEDLNELIQKFIKEKEKEGMTQKELRAYVIYHLLNGPVTPMIWQAYFDQFPALRNKEVCFLLLSPDGPVTDGNQCRISQSLIESLSPLAAVELEMSDKPFFTYLVEKVNIEKLHQLLKTLRDQYNQSFSIGLSTETENLAMFQESFLKAKYALHNRLTSGSGKIHRYTDDKVECENIILEKIEKLSVLVKSCNEELSQSELLGILEICQKYEIPSRKFFAYIREILNSISKGMDDFHLKKDYFLELDQFERFIEQFHSLEEMKDYLCSLLVETISISRQSVLELKSLSLQAIKYMEEHFQDCEMGLAAIADHMHVNSSYLSRIFKKETGLTIIEYLTKIRMENAKQLLLNGCKNIQFVAEMTGFSDPHYFSRCFKKYFHIPPSKMI